MEEQNNKQIAFWANEADLKNIAQLREKTGISSNAEILRYCVKQAVLKVSVE